MAWLELMLKFLIAHYIIKSNISWILGYYEVSHLRAIKFGYTLAKCYLNYNVKSWVGWRVSM